jgi:hypothetical protein
VFLHDDQYVASRGDQVAGPTAEVLRQWSGTRILGTGLVGGSARQFDLPKWIVLQRNDDHSWAVSGPGLEVAHGRGHPTFGDRQDLTPVVEEVLVPVEQNAVALGGGYQPVAVEKGDVVRRGWLRGVPSRTSSRKAERAGAVAWVILGRRRILGHRIVLILRVLSHSIYLQATAGALS